MRSHLQLCLSWAYHKTRHFSTVTTLKQGHQDVSWCNSSLVSTAKNLSECTQRSPMSPCGGQLLHPVWPCCLLLEEEVGWEDARFLCMEIHPSSMFTFNSTCAVSFLSGRVHPLSFESPFQLSVSLLLIFFPFSSPPISSLYSFHLNTNCSSSFNLISYTLQFSPAFPLLQPWCLQKTWKKFLFCFAFTILFQLFAKYYTPLGEFATQLWTNSGTL